MTKPNGRGRGWQRKSILQRRARRIARFRAGLILDAALSDGWAPDDLVKRYGPDGMEEIRGQLGFLAEWLRETGHPEGKAHS